MTKAGLHNICHIYDKTKTYKYPHKKNDDNLHENELYMISRGNEHHYFTSLHKIGKYINKQRMQVELAFLKKRPINGWNITIIDGKDIPWGSIDCDNVK